jgi:hypothetical protein
VPNGLATRCKLLRVPRVPAALAGLGAILFGFWFAWRLWLVIGVLQSISSTGSGGVGAVSAGLLDVGPELLAFVVAVAANRLIARWARASGGAVRAMHIAHSTAIAAVLILWIFLFVGVLAVGSIAPGLLLIAALSIPVLSFAQLGILSILLALFAWQHRRRALTA